MGTKNTVKQLHRLVTVSFFYPIDGDKPSTEERTKTWNRVKEFADRQFNQGTLIKSVSIDVYNDAGEIVNL